MIGQACQIREKIGWKISVCDIINTQNNNKKEEVCL